ncbi:fumarate reductase (CoM/CoB) subunit TfrB [Methanobrevibacter filiformis]|uniref:Fumarate reductase iron-sulfur subunit n=1 Tax=Methanobrevibacter filiformis TaxID=55758 RepID=A0A166AHA4_9EURY|nr:fumarate reductase (CoM/CoB) subunit TfrB [Methanobrevibacter filiformis]KZX12031.1 fumarate reductase iron-sulfur subunit [Methanobrevibacter filiformis]
MINIDVLRFDCARDTKPYFEKFKVDKKRKMKVLDALNYINEKYDANLGFRSSCRAGQCGSCGLKVNGEVKLGCKSEINDGDKIEPMNFPVIKDLIVDKQFIEDKVKDMDFFLETCENDPDSCSDNRELSKNQCLNEPQIIFNNTCSDTKKVRTCIECYSCLSACPVLKETKEFLGPYFMRYISKFDFDPRDIGHRTEESITTGLYSCTSCGKCGEVCPKEINSFGDAIEKLREIAYNKDLGPLEPHKKLKELIEKTGRSIEPLEESFIEVIAKKKYSDNSTQIKEPNNKIGIFTGCMVDYRLQDVGFALMDVLSKNGVEAEVIEGQVCCGSPLLRTGQTSAVNDLVKKNEKAMKEYDLILTVCAGCGATLKNDYPKYGVNLNVQDISEFLVDKLNTNDMIPLNLKVTYHDPCHLVRGQNISKQPREILNKIKGVEFIEMEIPDQCCGAGGGVKSGKPEIAKKLGEEKAKMVEKLNVDAVITICPFCQYNIQDSLDSQNLENIKVINILELLKRSYEPIKK